MGNSFTDFKGKGFSAKDGQVCVWLYLLVEEIQKIANPPSWLKELEKYWHEQATLSINGCINAGLDEALTDAEKTELIIKTSEAALKRLRDSWPKISLKTEYSYSTGGPAIICNDVDIKIHERYGVEFIKLLRGEVKSNELSTKAVWPTDLYKHNKNA